MAPCCPDDLPCRLDELPAPCLAAPRARLAPAAECLACVRAAQLRGEFINFTAPYVEIESTGGAATAGGPPGPLAHASP
jgi:hypothetical protein